MKYLLLLFIFTGCEKWRLPPDSSQKDKRNYSYPEQEILRKLDNIENKLNKGCSLKELNYEPS